MIYELLKAQNQRVTRLVEEITELRRDMNQRFNQVDKRLDRLEDKTDHMDQRLRGVEDKVDGIRISWSTKLVGGILATSASVSAVVALIMTSIL